MKPVWIKEHYTTFVIVLSSLVTAQLFLAAYVLGSR